MTQQNDNDNAQHESDITQSDEENTEEQAEAEVTDMMSAAAEEAKRQAEMYKQMAARTQADFENFRKRNAEAVRKSREEGISDTLVEILPVLDNLERAVSAIADEASRQGVAMIVKQFNQVLSAMGVEEIPSAGQAFDPNLHNAVMQESVEGMEPGMVAEVLQKGYKYHNRVIRHAMVKVSG